MCGFAGFVGSGDERDLAAMSAAVAHRGPDGEGAFIDPEAHVFLAHRRLAILDLHDGAQPMWNGDRTICVVFNGEIYNHKELRRTLESVGHKFQTDHSDTEVLIHGYAEWGEQLPDKLHGMFAFCLYDRAHRRLFFGRDRFGEKPLYIARQGGTFFFASELNAIVRHSKFSARIAQKSLQKFLAYGFLPAPNAILEDCEKLPGGCALTFDIVGGEVRKRRYWQFRVEPDDAMLRRAEGDLAEELRHNLIQAVRRRLIADVPLGFFLSGGIDSSSVVWAASRLLPQDQIQTFTLGFKDASYDESLPALDIARAFGTQHHVDWLDLDTARDAMPAVLDSLDEPMGDASIFPTHRLSRFARRHVKVVLTGDGGDELLAGYDPFSALVPAQLYRTFVPRPLHALLKHAAHKLPISLSNMSLDFKLRRTLAGLNHEAHLWNPVWPAPAGPEQIAALFEHPLPAEELYSEAIELWDASGTHSLVDRTIEFYGNFYLQDGVLTKVDRASMRASLEARAVFLDNDLVDFCRRLPHQLKFRDGCRKYLL